MGENIESFLRHLLGFIGGFLVSKGIIDEGTLMELIGALMTILAFVWSYFKNERKKKED